MASLRKESSNRILGCDGRREEDAAADDDDDEDVMEQLLVEAIDLVTDGTLWW